MKKLMSAIAVATMFAACGAESTDYQKAAETLAVDLARDNLGEEVTASCEEPSSTDVGTTFSCSVTFDDGSVRQVDARIIDGEKVEINDE